MLRGVLRGGKLLQQLQYGGGAIGKICEQMSMDRTRQMIYARLPIMADIRNIRIEIDPVTDAAGDEVWPGKIIESVDPVRDDVKVLTYLDVEKVQQAENMIFSEVAQIGIENLVDPLMYDNWRDILIEFGKVTWLVDYDTHVSGDQFLIITIFNLGQRNIKVYYKDVLIYEGTAWRYVNTELEQIAPPPEEGA